MAVVVVPRRNLQDNHDAVAAFGRTLVRAFEDWASAPMSTTLPSLSIRLQALAEGAFESAYLRGKRQALPKVDLDVNDIGFIRSRLQRNATYIKTQLEPDIVQKIDLQKLSGGADTVEVLTRAFSSRIENLYGGTLWHMQEAGFAAGVRALAKIVRTRPRPITQETLSERMKRKAREQQGDFTATPESLARDAPTVESWDQQLAKEIAARQQALTDAQDAEMAAGVSEPELAVAFNVPERELVDLITQPDFRVGTKYNCEQDAASCDPCVENAHGGEDGDGIYWEPDQPPMPGEDCDGFNNCRCTLETVYG